MKIISLVPSWTETLLECSLDVVGRTRFCIHPELHVQRIPALGGTKDLDVRKLAEIPFDLILLDREENTQEMAQKIEPLLEGREIFVTHVRSVSDVALELERLAERIEVLEPTALNQVLKLRAMAVRWRTALEASPPHKPSCEKFPGVLKWLTPPPASFSSLTYVIWKKPWMAVTEGTFIASMLERLGVPNKLIWPTLEGTEARSRYPEFQMQDLPKGSLLLFSSEPYPFGQFAKRAGQLGEFELPPGVSAALVDGESFSWFGARSLLFLENYLGC